MTEPFEEMLTIKDVCRFFGGTKSPVDRSTIYRWVRLKKLPEPIRMGPMTNRWRLSDCQSALKAMEAKQ